MKAKTSGLPGVDYIRSVLSYDPVTGIITWSSRVALCIHIGDEAGYLRRKDGYRMIKINDTCILSHRLAWAYIYGKWPEHDIDHINGVKDDNRIENLRHVLHRENNSNNKRVRNGGLVGAHYHKQSGKWVSSALIGRVKIYIGIFDTEQEAHDAYLKVVPHK
jgi:hypothetical protein